MKIFENDKNDTTSSDARPGKELTKLLKHILKNYDRKIRPFYGGRRNVIHCRDVLIHFPIKLRSVVSRPWPCTTIIYNFFSPLTVKPLVVELDVLIIAFGEIKEATMVNSNVKLYCTSTCSN